MFLLQVVLASILSVQASLAASPISISSAPPADSPPPIPESYVSHSIEFSSFPDYAGNSSAPNKFSYNLLTNLARIQGSYPIVRVGGNTQDYYLLNSSQSVALIGIFNTSRSRDYPTTITIGPSYFDSYSTWPNVTFTHGFNLGKNGTAAEQSRLACTALVCKALGDGKLAYWELGNEPDLYKTSSQGPVRPSTWNEQDYVNEWLNKTRVMKTMMQKTCPGMIQAGKFKFIAPSFAGTTNSLAPVKTWKSGLDSDKDIALISGHNYINGAESPGVTLQGTLMNHSMTVASVSKQLANWTQIAYSGIPFIFGETNSLYNEGKPGLSNSFGAALWGADFNLYCASRGVTRIHMHQGTNYRYQAWQPIQTINATLGTKPPYYGTIAVASFLGNLTKGNVTVVNIELPSIYEAAYVAYVDGALARIAVIQMREYNTTSGSTVGARPVETYSFQMPAGVSGQSVKVQRLMANGSDAISGVTFAGVSYNYELDAGQPVVMKNTTAEETVMVAQSGLLQVSVPWSSAAILSLR